jgi:hypothetical protein
VSVKWVAAMAIIIDDWIDFINNCHELSEVYKEDGLYEKSKNIWSIYNTIKEGMAFPLRGANPNPLRGAASNTNGQVPLRGAASTGTNGQSMAN